MKETEGRFIRRGFRWVTGRINRMKGNMDIVPPPPPPAISGPRGEAVVPTPAQINNLVAQINAPLTVPAYVPPPPPSIPKGYVTIGW